MNKQNHRNGAENGGLTVNYESGKSCEQKEILKLSNVCAFSHLTREIISSPNLSSLRYQLTIPTSLALGRFHCAYVGILIVYR